jgi:hypothetical protein
MSLLSDLIKFFISIVILTPNGQIFGLCPYCIQLAIRTVHQVDTLLGRRGGGGGTPAKAQENNI